MPRPKKSVFSTIPKTLGWIAIILFVFYALTDNEDVLGIALLIIFALLLYIVVRVLIKALNASSSSWSMLISEIKENRTAKETIASEEDSEAKEKQTEERERPETEAVRQYYQTHSRWHSRQFTIHTHTNTDVIENVSTKFGFNDIPYVVDPDGLLPKYLLTGENEEKAKKDILAINGFLDIARNRASSFPVVQISEDMLLFDPPTDPFEPFNFCYLQANVFTKKTNKLSKYPVSLHFAETNRAHYRIWGSIDYFADGEIGKVQIFGWRKDERFELYCKTNIYDFLELRKIVYNGNTVYKSELEDVQIPNHTNTGTYQNISLKPSQK